MVCIHLHIILYSNSKGLTLIDQMHLVKCDAVRLLTHEFHLNAVDIMQRVLSEYSQKMFCAACECEKP